MMVTSFWMVSVGLLAVHAQFHSKWSSNGDDARVRGARARAPYASIIITCGAYIGLKQGDEGFKRQALTIETVQFAKEVVGLSGGGSGSRDSQPKSAQARLRVL